MMNLLQKLTPTEVFDRAADFSPEAGAVVIFSRGGEERCAHMNAWLGHADNTVLVCIEPVDEDGFRFSGSGQPGTVALRSRSGLRNFWSEFKEAPVYIDLTGVPASVWPSLLKSGLEEGIHLRVIYVEPHEYTLAPRQTEGEIFDLTERLSGIAPIPGFAKLAEVAAGDWILVPILGFEGARFLFVLGELDPPRHSIFPVVGLPGFLPEFPYHSYLGNRKPLLDTQAWKSVRFALAHCPFSLFRALEAIHEVSEGRLMRIAPLGTKPHMLGAVLFACTHAESVELVYDHPHRKADCTSGVGRLLVYDIEAFVSL